MKPSSLPELAVRQFSLEAKGRRIRISDGAVVGRGIDCEIRLDDQMVSRRHARFAITHEGLVLEDLGSANGVFVDGKIAAERQVLEGGEQVRFGGHSFIAVLDAAPRSRIRGGTTSGDLPSHRRADPRDVTANSDMLDTLVEAANQARAVGDTSRAIKLLSPVVEAFCEEASVAKSIEPRFEEIFNHWALYFARETADGEWLNRLVRLYAEVETPLPEATVRQLVLQAPKCRGVDWNALRCYEVKVRASTEGSGEGPPGDVVNHHGSS